MNELQIFNNSEFGEIRTVEIEGKPYFYANDIAKALGYASPKDAITRHCKGAINHRYLTNGGEQEARFIPEGDIYRLVIKSQLPSAERFESWVFDEVIPSIRKTGAYAPKSQLEVLQLAINNLVEQERQMKELSNRVDMIEAKTVTSPVDYYTIAGFASLRKSRIDVSLANLLGRKAAKISREYGYDVGKVSDPRYGTVNTYHVDILTKLFDEV